ncbi:hypothetical protein FRC03_009298 [Tulasnella sp. 419]|nr:hypothetical protein FRC03_009298 [Tulasnella sp. 419]
MADLEAIATQAITVVTHMEWSRYTTIAGATLLFYDHALTFGDEIRLIWPARLSLVKVLFLINRYVTPAFQAYVAYGMSRLAVFDDKVGTQSIAIPSPTVVLTIPHCRRKFVSHTGASGVEINLPHSCQRFISICSYVEITCLAISNYLLLLRVHALWGRRRSVLISLLVVYAVTYTAVLSTATITLFALLPSIHYSPLARVCAVGGHSETLSSVWIAPIFFEVVVFVMTTVKCVEHAKTDDLKIPLLKSLYRDQFLYFLVIIIVRIFNLLVWLAMPTSLAFLGVYFIWSLVITFVSRMLLNLKGVMSPESWENETRMVIRQDLKATAPPELSVPLHRLSAPTNATTFSSAPENVGTISSTSWVQVAPTGSAPSPAPSQLFDTGNTATPENPDMVSVSHSTSGHYRSTSESAGTSRTDTPSSLSHALYLTKNQLFPWKKLRKSQLPGSGVKVDVDQDWDSYEDFVELDEVHTVVGSRRSLGSQWPLTPSPTQVTFDIPLK